MTGNNNSDGIEVIDIEEVKQSLLEHRLAEGEWLSASKDGGYYILEHGPLAGEFRVATLNNYMNEGLRNLPKGLSIAQANAEISQEYGMDYVNYFESAQIKREVAAKSQADDNTADTNKTDNLSL